MNFFALPEGMPTVAFLGMNRFGEKVYEYLVDHDDTEVLGVFTEESQYSSIRTLEPEFLISAGFDYIIPAEILDVPAEDAINLHPSFLPYNRGVNPDVWSIIKDEPAGVTIHYMTPDVDAGSIIAQRTVDVQPSDTGRDLRKRLDRALVKLFKESWEDIYTGRIVSKTQNLEVGAENRKADFQKVCEIDLDAEVRVRDFIDRLRALTFTPYHNAYFKKGGSSYYVRISIESEENAQFDEFEWDEPTLFKRSHHS